MFFLQRKWAVSAVVLVGNEARERKQTEAMTAASTDYGLPPESPLVPDRASDCRAKSP